MSYQQLPALARRLPSMDLQGYPPTTHIHPSQLIPQSTWHNTDHASSSSSAPYSSWSQTTQQHTSPDFRGRGTWSLPSESSFGNSMAEYPGSASQFDSDYLKSALVADSFPAQSRPSSSSSHASNLDPPRFEAASWDNDLYRFEPNAELDQDEPSSTTPALALSVSSASPRSGSPCAGSPCVKQEDIVSDDFVFEGPVHSGQFPAFASMTQVPLRATGAPKGALPFMGVFRLNPFAIHNAAPQDAKYDWSGDRIGPLRSLPKTFEFQLDLCDAVKPESPPSYSPAPQSPSLSSSSLSYHNDQEEEERAQSWVSSPPSLLYSPPVVHETAPFETVMTPAQSLDWQMRYQTPAADASHYSTSPSSLRSASVKDHRSSYAQKDVYSRVTHSSTSPLRLPPPTPSSRYISMPAVQDADAYSDDSGRQWYNKSISLAMFYQPSKDTSDPSLLLPPATTTTTTALSLGAPHHLSSKRSYLASTSPYPHEHLHHQLHHHQPHAERTSSASLRY